MKSLKPPYLLFIALLIFTILGSIYLLSGNKLSLPKGGQNKEIDRAGKTVSQVSSDCLSRGGQFIPHQDSGRYYNTCDFEDGTSCEEEAFAKGKCPK